MSLSHITVTPNKLIKALERMLPLGLVPYVQGPPGVGKSDIFKQFADKFGMKVIDIRLSTHAPEDLTGLPMRKADGIKAEFAPFDMFPLENDEIPDGYNGWLVILDEMSSASKALQAAAYKVVLDREVGLHKLHPQCLVVAAGNRMSDKAVVIPQSTAMQSRLVHYELEVSQRDWMEWAIRTNQDYRVRGFIAYKPSVLHSFNPDHQDKTFPCPRTWEFVSRYIKGRDTLDEVDEATVAGCISDGYGTEFIRFAEIVSSVPSIQSIISAPDNTEIPKESSYRYFIISSLIDHTTKKNIDKIIKYVSRFPQEFMVIYLRALLVRDESFRNNPDFSINLSKVIKFMHED